MTTLLERLGNKDRHDDYVLYEITRSGISELQRESIHTPTVSPIDPSIQPGSARLPL